MPQKTNIEWCDMTSNPIRAARISDGKRGWSCTKVSPGCAGCYSEAINRRFGTGLDYTDRNRDLVHVTLSSRELDAIGRIKKPSKFFVCDMTDLFHEDVEDYLILRVFDAMRRCTWAGGQNCGKIGYPGHTFQVLTKRAERMREFCSRLRWDGDRLVLSETVGRPFLPLERQIWVGVSVEDQVRVDERIPHLLATPAAVRWLSVEPLLGPVNLGLWRVAHPKHREDWPAETVRNFWVICGSESGPRARPMDEDWVRSIRDQCQSAGVPFFYKQKTVNGKKVGLPELDSRQWAEYPESEPLEVVR
jgi:protein gp37